MTNFTEARIRKVGLGAIRPQGQYVLYWCQMARRLTHNHALDHAIQQAETLGVPLVVYEGLKLHYPWACARFHAFLLQGMQDNVRQARIMGLTYWPFVETPQQPGHGLVKRLANDACLVVTDDYPAYIVPAQIRALAASVSVAIHAVDTNSVVPLSLLGAPVAAAAHLRPRLHKLFPQAWPHRANPTPEVSQLPAMAAPPPFDLWVPPKDLEAYVANLPIDQSVPPVPECVGGASAGHAQLKNFLKDRLPRYADHRNQPDAPERGAASALSPYLHYGHLSIEEVVAVVLHSQGTWSLNEINPKTRNKDDYFCRDANVNAFLDEAITWRDVGYHWHYQRDRACDQADLRPPHVSWHTDTESTPAFNFQRMDFTPSQTPTLPVVLPAWALATLGKHEDDRRDYLYSLDDLEQARTHDELWNAAQLELVATGRMHNYLRMLWGKKVLEWSETPEEGYRILEHLNNKYALDGRDPNSYTGILWCFGLFDRPWPPERQIFGTIRYMSSANTAKKFKLDKYYQYVRRITASL